LVDCFRSFRCRGDWNRPGDRSKRGEARPREHRCNRAGGDLSHRGISGSPALMHWGLAREKAGFPVGTETKTIARSAIGGDPFCGELFVRRSRPFSRRFGIGTADRVQHLSGNRSCGGRLHLPHPETTLRSRSGSGGRSLGGAQLAPLAGNSRLVACGRSPGHDALAVVDASLGEGRYASRTRSKRHQTSSRTSQSGRLQRIDREVFVLQLLRNTPRFFRFDLLRRCP